MSKFDEMQAEFMRIDYGGMVGNLNKISDHMLTVKWYFLAAIAAIGTGDKFLLGSKSSKIGCLSL